MNRRLRRIAAVLFVVAAGLFVISVNAEDDTHTEATTAPVPDESAESGEADHDEAAEAVGGEEHSESREEKVLGVDVESPASVALAVVVSLALAAGLWLRPLRWLALLAFVVGLAFAAFDVAEVVHQLDESNSGLATLAATIAAGWTARTQDAPS